MDIWGLFATWLCPFSTPKQESHNWPPAFGPLHPQLRIYSRNLKPKNTKALQAGRHSHKKREAYAAVNQLYSTEINIKPWISLTHTVCAGAQQKLPADGCQELSWSCLLLLAKSLRRTSRLTSPQPSRASFPAHNCWGWASSCCTNNWRGASLTIWGLGREAAYQIMSVKELGNHWHRLIAYCRVKFPLSVGSFDVNFLGMSKTLPTGQTLVHEELSQALLRVPGKYSGEWGSKEKETDNMIILLTVLS